MRPRLDAMEVDDAIPARIEKDVTRTAAPLSARPRVGRRKDELAQKIASVM
jgi:hypothetical protein